MNSFTKSQVSIFVIIGVVVLLMSTVFITTVSLNKQEDLSEVSGDSSAVFSSVKEYMDSCSDEVLGRGVEIVGIQGGSYDISREFEYYSGFVVPYFFDGEIGEVPTEEDIEIEVSKFLNDNFELCVDGLKSSGELNISTQSFAPESEVSISNYEVGTTVSYPITVQHLGSRKTFRSFSSDDVDYNFEEKLEVAKIIVDLHRDDPFFIPISELNKLAIEYDFRYSLVNLEEDLVLYQLAFNNELNDEIEVFAFLIKYKEFEG